jgi:hypothetical protein
VRVDFRAARRQIEHHSEIPGVLRRAALSTYIGLFDLAEDGGRLETSGDAIIEALGITRMTWAHHREVLNRTGLLEVGPRCGRHPTVMRLLPPGRD